MPLSAHAPEDVQEPAPEPEPEPTPSITDTEVPLEALETSSPNAHAFATKSVDEPEPAVRQEESEYSPLSAGEEQTSDGIAPDRAAARVTQ